MLNYIKQLVHCMQLQRNVDKKAKQMGADSENHSIAVAMIVLRLHAEECLEFPHVHIFN